MTSQTKVEKAKNHGLGAAQNLAKFSYFSSVKVDVAKNSQSRSNMPYSYFFSLKTIFFKIHVTCTLRSS